MKRFHSGFLFLFLVIGSLHSMAQVIRFDRISIEEGLSQSIVQCVIQDSRGFMWFGTEDGLNRYDGYNFTVMRQIPGNINSLSHNNVLALYEDKTGLIWIGTFLGGLSTFDYKTNTFTHYRNDVTNANSLSNNLVFTIYEDHAGMMWIGTQGGLNRFDRKTTQFKRFQHVPTDPHSLSDNSVHAIVQDRSGTLWIGTENGLNQFDPQTGRFTRFQRHSPKKHSLSHNDVRAIHEDQNGILWIGTNGGGLNTFNPQNGQFDAYRFDPRHSNSISSNTVYAITEDTRPGELWIGTAAGLNHFDPKTKTFSRYTSNPSDRFSLSNGDIRSIYKDRSGVIWIGTYGGGANKFNGKKKEFMHYITLTDKIVWSVWEEDAQYLWVGTQTGLNKFDRTTGQIIPYRLIPGSANCLSSNTIRFIFEDRFKTLWLGTHGGGLNTFNRKSEKFRVYTHSENPNSLSHDELRSVYEDRSGTLWFGTNGGGLNRFNREKDNFTVYKNNANDPSSLSNDFIRCMVEDSHGNFWIGTQGGGLNQLDRSTGKFTRYTNDPHNPLSLSNDYVFAICEAKSGELFIGTYGGGLNRFDPVTKKFTHIDVSDMGRLSICGMLMDNDGNLWLSTNHGLLKYNPNEKTFKHYTERDGLQSNEFNGGACYKSPGGELFFGGINGFNAFYPERIKDSAFIPPIVITSFLKCNKETEFDKPISELKELVLDPSDYFFSFEFTALDFTAPQKNKYKYKMKGIDPDWIETDSNKRFASYTTLDPGQYTFMVKGTNCDGKWNDAGAAIRIKIKPPLWKTPVFIGFIFLLLLLLLYYFHGSRTVRLAQTLEKERLEKELKLKADFTAMLVHDLRSPLTAVIGYSDLLKNHEKQIDIVRVGNIIYRSSVRMLNLINDMLDFSKFEAGKMRMEKRLTSITHTIAEAVDIMSPILLRKELSLELSISPDVKTSGYLIDPEKIGQVLNNFLSNAAKFAPHKSTVKIEATNLPKDWLEVAVTDTGPGISSEKQAFLFDKYAQLGPNRKEKGTGLGLAVSKLIIEAHGGTIGCRTGKENSGCVFFFRIPGMTRESC
ncbi:MAG: two-component regulator propeller domain-containing protein [Candidatus Omnitrophota bacterium]